MLPASTGLHGISWDFRVYMDRKQMETRHFTRRPKTALVLGGGRSNRPAPTNSQQSLTRVLGHNEVGAVSKGGAKWEKSAFASAGEQLPSVRPEETGACFTNERAGGGRVRAR